MNVDNIDLNAKDNDGNSAFALALQNGELNLVVEVFGKNNFENVIETN